MTKSWLVGYYFFSMPNGWDGDPHPDRYIPNAADAANLPYARNPKAIGRILEQPHVVDSPVSRTGPHLEDARLTREGRQPKGPRIGSHSKRRGPTQ